MNELYIIETNVDDVDGELIGHLIEVLHSAGSPDASVYQGIGKKGRPTFLIRVLAHAKDLEKLSTMLMEETGTLGVRIINCDRHIAVRTVVNKTLRLFGRQERVRLKISKFGNKLLNIKPEFEDVKRIATRAKLPLRTVRTEILRRVSSK